MLKPDRDNFSSTVLNQEDEMEGSKFTTLQKQVIQNHISTYANDLVNLEPDPNNYAKFIQQQAHTKGQIDALNHLLAVCESIENDDFTEAVRFANQEEVIYNETNAYDTFKE